MALLSSLVCSRRTMESGRLREIRRGDASSYPQQVADNTHVRLWRSFTTPAVALLVALSPVLITPASLGQTIDIQKGASLFGTSCIGCHDAGGNIIQPGATLFTKDLERNGVNTEEEIYRVTYFGKGRMPGFGETCTPRGQCTFGPRLKDEEIQLLAEYVKLQADQGWEVSGN